MLPLLNQRGGSHDVMRRLLCYLFWLFIPYVADILDVVIDAEIQAIDLADYTMEITDLLTLVIIQYGENIEIGISLSNHVFVSMSDYVDEEFWVPMSHRSFGLTVHLSSD